MKSIIKSIYGMIGLTTLLVLFAAQANAFQILNQTAVGINAHTYDMHCHSKKYHEKCYVEHIDANSNSRPWNPKTSSYELGFCLQPDKLCTTATIVHCTVPQNGTAVITGDYDIENNTYKNFECHPN